MERKDLLRSSENGTVIMRQAEFLLDIGLMNDLNGKPILLLNETLFPKEGVSFQRCVKYPVIVLTQLTNNFYGNSLCVGITGNVEKGILTPEEISGYSYECCSEDLGKRSDVFLISKMFDGVLGYEYMLKLSEEDIKLQFKEACKIMSPRELRLLIKRNASIALNDVASAVVCLNPKGQGKNIEEVIRNTDLPLYMCSDELLGGKNSLEVPEFSEELAQHLIYLTGDNSIEHVQNGFSTTTGFGRMKCIKRPGKRK